MADPSYVNANVNINVDTVASLITKTNQLLASAASTTVTVDPLAPSINATTLGLSSGNGFVIGQFGANTLVAANGIQGGTIGSPAVLNLLTNTMALGTLGGNVVNFTTATIANSTITRLTLSNNTITSITSISNSTSIGLASNTELATTLAIKNYVANVVSTAGSGSVSSVNASGGSTGLIFTGGPITSTGTLALANSSTLGMAFGGTGANTQQGALDNLAGSIANGQFLRGNGTHVAMSSIIAADVPLLNQNTTGTAGNVTGVVSPSNGGTGANNAAAGFNNLSPIMALGDLIIGTGANTAGRLAIGSANTVLVSNGSSASWQTYNPGFGAATLRNVTPAYALGGQVFIQTSTPTANNAGDIWLQF